jgi:hypothetical protein
MLFLKGNFVASPVWHIAGSPCADRMGAAFFDASRTTEVRRAIGETLASRANGSQREQLSGDTVL